jgi:hypothetical protein
MPPRAEVTFVEPSPEQLEAARVSVEEWKWGE